jgi:hypothetical protein
MKTSCWRTRVVWWSACLIFSNKIVFVKYVGLLDTRHH